MTNVKRAAGVAQVVAYLPSKEKALNSTPSTARKKKKESRRYSCGSCLQSKLLEKCREEEHGLRPA
jgi:hypothetical protein